MRSNVVVSVFKEIAIKRQDDGYNINRPAVE